MGVVQKSVDASTAPVFQGTEYSYTRDGGHTVTKTYRGTNDQLLGLYSDSSEQDPASMTLTREGDSPVWILRVTWAGDPGQEPPGQQNEIVSTFELMDNQLLQSTSTSKVLEAGFTSDGYDPTRAIEYVRKIFQDYQRGQYKTLNDLTSARATCVNNFGQRAGTLWDHLVKDVQSFNNFHYVFRVTRTVTSQADITTSFVGIKQIWTAPQIVNYEAVPQDTFFALTAVGGQWLKTPPNVVQAANARTQISYEYWHADEWSTLYYDTYAG